MKKLLLPLVFLFAFSACSHMPDYKKDGLAVFTVTDEGILFKDTVWKSNNQMALTHDFEIAYVRNDSDRNAYASSRAMIVGKQLKRDTCSDCFYSCTMHKSGDHSQITLIFNVHGLISLAIVNAEGPLSGTGIFTTKGADTTIEKMSKQPSMNVYVENFDGGQKYNIDSAHVKVSTSSNSLLEGTYKLWLKNASGSKIRKGTFSCKNAVVN